MSVAFRIALAALALLATSAARADDEATAADLAAIATTQAFGASAIEIWQSDWQEQQLTFGLARRWQGGRVEVLLRVLTPHRYEPLAFLLRPRENGSLAIEYFRSPRLFPIDLMTGRTLEIQVASPIERLPFVPGLPAVADIWPPRAADFQAARLPDGEVEGRPCRVLEQRLRRRDGEYDRIVTSLARDSDLALETRFLRGDRLVRRVTIAPTDIDRTEGRPIARRRTIERPGEATQVLTLARFSLDPVFPDQLFTSSNLRTGRFPSY